MSEARTFDAATFRPDVTRPVPLLSYYRQAVSGSGNETKWVFSLQGGGECVSEDECRDRTTGALGSSKYFSDDGAGLMVRVWKGGVRFT